MKVKKLPPKKTSTKQNLVTDGRLKYGLDHTEKVYDCQSYEVLYWEDFIQAIREEVSNGEYDYFDADEEKVIEYYNMEKLSPDQVRNLTDKMVNFFLDEQLDESIEYINMFKEHELENTDLLKARLVDVLNEFLGSNMLVASPGKVKNIYIQGHPDNKPPRFFVGQMVKSHTGTTREYVKVTKIQGSNITVIAGNGSSYITSEKNLEEL